jgi:hypothetical protein
MVYDQNYHNCSTLIIVLLKRPGLLVVNPFHTRAPVHLLPILILLVNLPGIKTLQDVEFERNFLLHKEVVGH